MSHCRESLVYNIVGVVCWAAYHWRANESQLYIFNAFGLTKPTRFFVRFLVAAVIILTINQKRMDPLLFFPFLYTCMVPWQNGELEVEKKMLFNIVGRAVKNQTKRNSTSSNGVIGQINEDLQDFSNCYIIPIVNCSKIRWAMSKQKCVLSCSNLQSVPGIFLF
jgi:hypothetical protein